MAEPTPDPKMLLRDDLSKEYYAILTVVSSYDGWLLVVKGWSVTLSLAGLGLGFQQQHFALFALAAVTGAAFWFLDEISAPRIDMMWGFAGYPVKNGEPQAAHKRGWLLRRPDQPPADWRGDEPWRRTPQEVYSDLRTRFWWPNVVLPHAIAVVLGSALFIAAALDLPGLDLLSL